MKTLVICACLLGPLAFAGDVTITIPDTANAQALSMCEQLRVQMRVNPSAWTIAKCAEEFFYRGLRTFTAENKTSEVRQTAVAEIQAETAAFDVGYPIPNVASTCGDSVVDVFDSFNEECDDGNEVDTDACVDCLNAVCGDGLLHAGVEDCDDGNTTPGDGCDATCNIE